VPGLITLFDNEILGYRVVMSGIGILCIVLVLLCFFNTKERVYTPVDNSLSFKKQFTLMLKNDQAMCMFADQAITMIQNTLKFGAAAYFIKYVIEAPTSSLSALLTAGSVAGIIAPLFANYLLKHHLISRKNLLVLSQIVGGVILFILGLLASDSILVNCALFFVSILAGELIAILVWASVADAGDYGYDKDAVRITGIISRGMLFATKLGMTIGGALLGYVLAFYDYDPALAQNASGDQIFAFILLFAYLPAAFAFSFYRLEEEVCLKFKK
jgi:GPH family glycoside/pentoside/hexuronide:cation symporter